MKILKRQLICVDPKASVADAAKIMKKANIGSLFVGPLPKPLGIFTERDLVRKVAAEGLDLHKTRVEEVMTRKLITVDISEPLNKIFASLAQGGFRHLPITDKGGVVGIISLTDLAKVFKEMAEDDKFLQSFQEDESG